MATDLKIRISLLPIPVEFWYAPLCFAHKIFQKKKKKKRKPVFQVEGFKKAGFFEKILPDISSGMVESKL
ncbi:hypothetical protein [Flavobacterium sp.]|uniref:hypothetical protein n=1 Tax=Flavobacterium sp. TaxID=239 RepID=UPI0025FC81AA|nr:hypothetical protein [Flavobacterium sp.]